MTPVYQTSGRPILAERLALKSRPERKRATMSIGIALRCQDGLVLCADRELSNDDFSYYEPKV